MGAGTGYPAFLINDNDKLLFGKRGIKWIGFVSDTALEVNEWTHVAMTYNGTDLEFYLNGALDGFSSEDATFSAGNTAIGWSKSSDNFNGSIDEVIIYDKVLSEVEINDIYCKQGGGGAVCD